MEEIALVEKKDSNWSTNTLAQKEEVKKTIEAWRKKRKRGAWLKDFPKGHKYSSLYTEEEQMAIIETIAQKIMTDSLSLLDAIDALIKTGEIPGNKKESVYWLTLQWGYRNPELKRILKEARAERAYALVEEVQALDIEAITNGIKTIDPKIANAYATLHKTRTANLQWLAERISPENFSPKMQISGEIKHTMVSMKIIIPAEKILNRGD
ncbi:MAG: hypothetical protein NUV76_12295 [Candidatus Kuenenia sp.]|nr:hypothetical protein [Candidatus Kuenenia sp.]